MITGGHTKIDLTNDILRPPLYYAVFFHGVFFYKRMELIF